MLTLILELQRINNSLALLQASLTEALGFSSAVGSMLASLYGCWWLAF